MTKLPLKLKSKEPEFLNNLTKTGNPNSREFERVYVLLALDKDKKHEEISEFYNVSRITVWRVKNKYFESGVEEAIQVLTLLLFAKPCRKTMIYNLCGVLP
jgi:hypothetical protein